MKTKENQVFVWSTLCLVAGLILMYIRPGDPMVMILIGPALGLMGKAYMTKDESLKEEKKKVAKKDETIIDLQSQTSMMKDMLRERKDT